MAETSGNESWSSDRLSRDLLSRQFRFPSLAGSKVLILGVGGGCDIISAYALARMLRQTESGEPAQVVYANTKRHPDASLEPLAPHVFRVPPEVTMPEVRAYVHGTTEIDRSVPRGDRGCPWILCLSHKKVEQEELVTSLRRLDQWDMVITVDTGADSIVATAQSGSEGRDKTMLKILPGLGAPLLHIVIAPGCDGETAFDDLRETFHRWESTGDYLGCFPLDPMLRVYWEFSAALRRDRTPNIILDAHHEKLKTGPHGGLIVPRGISPEIPKDWLANGFVFRPSQDFSPEKSGLCTFIGKPTLPIR